MSKLKKHLTCEQIFELADIAGKKAANQHTPTPMIVQEHASPLNDNSPVVKQWRVNDGVCGFAWVNIRPGNCKFAQWIKKNKGGYLDCRGGISYWIGGYGQSMSTKEAYARAFAELLRKLGIKAHSRSRMD